MRASQSGLAALAASRSAAPGNRARRGADVDLHDRPDLGAGVQRRAGADGGGSPAVDGYVVGMSAEVVDAAGRVQGRTSVMLHHIVFAKVGTPDYTCGGFTERFFAEGEERMALSLPRGYGYPNKATDRWALLYMLMNHKPKTLKGYIRYHVRYVTGEALTPVKPVWLDVRNCSGLDPVFDVPGGGKSFSTFTETADFTMPESGRLVAGGGHLHGGGIRLALRNATCATKLFESRPTWGGPKPRPILHEPGPTKMSAFRSTEGIPVAKGQRLRLAAVYENHAPHTRAMGIMLLFFAPGRGNRVPAAPKLDGRSRAAFRAAGVLDAAAARAEGPGVEGAVDLGRRLPLRRGADLDPARLDVHLALRRRRSRTTSPSVGGPEGFSAPWTQRGTFTHRFTRPGTSACSARCTRRRWCSRSPSASATRRLK